LSEYAGPGFIPINCLTKELKLIKDIQKGKYSQEGAFEGLHYDDEITANGLLRKHISRDLSGWQYSKEKEQLDSGTWDRGLLVLHAQKTMLNITTCVLWWNSSKMNLPRNYIHRRLLDFTLHNSILDIVRDNLDDLLKVTAITPQFCALLHQHRLIIAVESQIMKRDMVSIFKLFNQIY